MAVDRSRKATYARSDGTVVSRSLARLSSTKMSIIFCTISRATFGLPDVAEISNRLSCCCVSLIAFCNDAIRSATSRSFATVSFSDVPRTTFSRFTADVSVWRMRSIFFAWSFCATAASAPGSTWRICTMTRAVDW